MTTILAAGRVVAGDALLEDGWVAVDGDTIVGVGTGPRPQGEVVSDAPDGVLVPGFIDLHCHGAAGGAFDDGPDAIAGALAFHRRHGTTRQLLSLVTASLEDVAERTRTAARACAADPLLLGIHLEGPFLAEARKGAHDARLLTDPTPSAIATLLEAGQGAVRMVTLAPERAGGADAIEQLRDAGVVVAVGHSDLDAAGAAAAFDAGATVLTHAFNGMRGLDHRTPGPVLAAFDHPEVTVEVIADGVHVAPRMVRLLTDNAPGRVALITDAMSATGLGDGEYLIGALPVRVTDGVPRLIDGDSIAGSTLTMDRAVRNAVALVGLDLVDAVTAATRVPARALGLHHRLGTLAPGYAADVVVLDDALAVRSVWADGRRLDAPD